MNVVDLSTDEGLRAACAAIGQGNPDWNKRLGGVLEWWAGLSVDDRALEASQRRLWEDNHVAAVGQGRIPLDKAFADEAFRRWLAERSLDVLPDDWTARLLFITALYDDLRIQLIRRIGESNIPHLKIYRAIAVMYPHVMTTVASRHFLRLLAKAMGAPSSLVPAARHVWVRRRIDAMLETPPSSWSEIAGRLALPWLVYDRYVASNDSSTEEGAGADDEPLALSPLPAIRRRRGLTATRGLFPAMLSTLEFVKKGVSREELLDFLKANSPDAKSSSLGVTINSYQSEFDVIESEGGRYTLTSRGESLLETQDPAHLADWILTRVIGADRAIADLRDKQLMSKPSLLAAIGEMNPGWTTAVTPQAIINWLLSLKIIQRAQGGGFSLTDAGKLWAERIHWTPEPLQDDDQSQGDKAEDVLEIDLRTLEVPPFSDVESAVSKAGHFPAGLVANLHAGLWAHPRRHFAVLTGLSGSGKTLLARAYAAALAGAEHAEVQTLTLPVQPGWYDPGALLGYINPLRSDSYVRTGFLEFLLRAAANPTRPHVVVLDEMNLSHPEQYMAPLLSAMETGDGIRLHAEDDVFDGVPRALTYPPNLVLIGTVNMDETTHGLSDKVLDRAFVLEHWDVDLDGYPRWSRPGLESAQVQKARAVLADLMAALSPVRLHFGYRVVDTVLDYLVRITADGSGVAFHEALDFVVYAKVLPKLRGEDSSRLRAALETCEGCLEKHALTRSRSKVQELRADLQATGSARFWR